MGSDQLLGLGVELQALDRLVDFLVLPIQNDADQVLLRPVSLTISARLSSSPFVAKSGSVYMPMLSPRSFARVNARLICSSFSAL